VKPNKHLTNLIRYLLITILSANIIFAKAKVDNDILISILIAEKQKEKPIGYQYLISFNNKREARQIKKQIPKYFLDNRTIDCKNTKICTYLTKELWKIGIRNLDLGAFQINSKLHKMKPENYFKLSTSVTFAKAYVKKMIKKYGYNWYSIASYHSQTPDLNYKYQKKLITNYFILKRLSLN